LQSFNAAPPNTLRLHSFQDGVFIPDVMQGWTIAGEDAEQAVLQTLDGTVRISLGDARIRLAFGSNRLTIQDSGITAIVGDKSLSITSTGTTIVGGLTIDGIVFGTHKHPITGGSSAPGPTGNPV
jgi:hypothetical protein